jgi:Trk K+ transport system NAD-binding subunit
MKNHPQPARVQHSPRRALRAQWRDARVLLGESRGPLLLFLALVLGGAVVFYFFYIDPSSGEHISFPQALYGTFTLIFFQGSLEFPTQWYLQILYFIIPILGLVAVVDGVVRFGSALTNKQERGQKWQVAMASTYSGHVIICGMGRVGYRVALELLKFGREVVAIESDQNCRFVEKALALGIPVIFADARRQENLIKAGIEQADAIIPCTNDELANLDIALDARELNPQVKVVMRMFDAELAARVERGFGIHTAYSVSALAAPTIAAASMRVSVRSSFYVGDTLLNISEVTVRPNSQIAGWSIQQLEENLDLSVVSYIDGETTHLHPKPDLRLSEQSKVLVLATLETLQQLEALNHKVD